MRNLRTMALCACISIGAFQPLNARAQPVDVDIVRTRGDSSALIAPNANAPVAFQVGADSALIWVDHVERDGFLRVIRKDKGPQAWVPSRDLEVAHAGQSAEIQECAKTLDECPRRGCEPEGTPDAVANELKRQPPSKNATATLTFADFAQLQHQADELVGEGPPELQVQKRTALTNLQMSSGTVSEGDPVRLMAYIAKGDKGLHANSSGESVNCQLKKPENNDFHIPAVNRVSDLEIQGIVVEMIPQNRPQGWTIAALKEIQAQGSQIWVEGKLLYDKVHYVEDDPNNPLKDEPARMSLWEIHPITKFLACRKEHCDPQNESDWTALDAK